jgi:hypothetical protein
MAYRGQVASEWLPNVQAPDLSNVLRESGRLGWTQGMNEFFATLQAERTKLAKAEATEARESLESAAASEASQDEEGEGFWSSIADHAKAGFHNIIDVLSRPLYGTANAFDEMVSMDKSGINDKNSAFDFSGGQMDPIGGLIGRSPFESIDDLWKDPSKIGDIGSAFWAGFKGEEKETFSQLMHKYADEDKRKTIHDNPAYQVAAGLTGDIFFDPSTYVGVGIVSKPAKVLKNTKAEAQIDRVAKEVEALNIKHTDGTDIPIDAKWVRQAIGGRVIDHKTLTRRQRNSMATRARKGKGNAARTKAVKNAIDNYAY